MARNEFACMKENPISVSEYGDIPLDRLESLEIGHKFYYPREKCKNGHNGKRSTSVKNCLECARLKMRERRKREDIKNREKEYQKQYYSKNKETIHMWNRKWYSKNSDGVKEYKVKYRQDNKNKCNALREEKRIRLKQRTPSWSDLSRIRKIYAEAREMKESTGIDYQVDHIVPLKGKTVSGLHVPENLRIVTAEENMRKHNDLIEELL